MLHARRILVAVVAVGMNLLVSGALGAPVPPTVQWLSKPPGPPGSDTPLHEAAFKGDKNRVEQLLAAGVDVNAKDRQKDSALHWAAGSGHKDIAELLLAKGADVTVKGTRGRTPLGFAEEMRHSELAELLRKHGAK